MGTLPNIGNQTWTQIPTQTQSDMLQKVGVPKTWGSAVLIGTSHRLFKNILS